LDAETGTAPVNNRPYRIPKAAGREELLPASESNLPLLLLRAHSQATAGSAIPHGGDNEESKETHHGN